METMELLHIHLEETCPEIYQTRLDAVMDVAKALQKSNDLSLTRMGRQLDGKMDVKYKIKKVDRLEGNQYLHEELHQLYMGLSEYVLTYLSQDKKVPIVVDLCFVKDDRELQMLSAEVATRGRTLPLYREIFNEGELQNRAASFLENLSRCIPQGREVILILDAGFYEDWLQAIENRDWYFVCRTRRGKSLQFSGENEWKRVKDFIPEVGERTKNYNDVLLTKRHQHPCRIVTTRKQPQKKRASSVTDVKRRKIASGAYGRSAKEPWILATNLPSEYKAQAVVKLYSKRMQIEESFRDMKSHQFGLGGRDIRTICVNRWGVKMLLAAIVQITYWILGVIGHSQGLQRLFQANTVRDKKVFSYFTLGKFLIEYDKLNELVIDYENLPNIIRHELAHGI